MPIVTITSDFGARDYYLPAVKGAMLCRSAALTIIDITHEIANYDIVAAAFIFKNAWRHFPKGTIHLVSVNDWYDKTCNFVAIRQEGHYFIGPDNGVFSLVFEEEPKEIYHLPPHSGSEFSLKEIYAQAVGHIAEGQPFPEIGSPIEELVKRITFHPVISHSHIRGSVIHIDNYENVMVNITRELFDQVGQERKFAVYFKRHDPITTLCRNYHDVAIGERLCLFNSANYLEIAINMGKAASLLGMKLEDTIQVDFRS